ncbi:HEPN domain-containing protein [Serratia plymuthica]|uniref:HEPN domain-containing protein n=1 Tax=Serratia plymuthica TaxID=82996 RepID=UPI003B9EFF26
MNMSLPIDIFNNAWLRCDVHTVVYAYTSKNTTAAFDTDEILRAEWVARVSALDLYIHELVAQKMVDIFKGIRLSTKNYEKFMLPHKVVDDIRNAPTLAVAGEIFNLEVRRQLGFVTYQTENSIADGIRLVSQIELWRQVAIHFGAPTKNVDVKAKSLRNQLNSIVDRRNKIAHEGDMQPITPRQPWPISSQELITVKSFIESLVKAIDSLV